jgi:hypothetical protein
MDMSNGEQPPVSEQRRLVQRILAGGIPNGKEMDECREILASGCDEQSAFAALFTLLQGALADPLFSIEDSERVVPVLKSLARGEVTVGELL